MIDTNSYFGTPLESHDVQTEDGYILTLKRIPGSSTKVISDKNEIQKTVERKPVVLVFHGIHCCGTDWLVQKLEKSLPYKLVQGGYDCWLGSNRGTKESRGHATLTTKSRKYWDFSVDDLARDTLVLIDYILSATGHSKLFYVGHSLGCTQFVVAMNLKQEYNSKIEMMVALCPAIYGKHLRNRTINAAKPFGVLLGKYKTFYRTAGEMFPKTAHEYAKIVCFPMKKPDKIGVWFLKKVGKLSGAVGKDHIAKDEFKIYSQHFPGPTSMKIYCHIAQSFWTGRMEKYNYGRSGNMKKYGQSKPPIYLVSNVTCPVVTMTSEFDMLIPPQDVAQVAKELPNLVQHIEIRIPNGKFQHADFMIGNTADVLVYDKIVEIFNKSMNISTDLE